METLGVDSRQVGALSSSPGIGHPTNVFAGYRWDDENKTQRLLRSHDPMTDEMPTEREHMSFTTSRLTSVLFLVLAFV